MQDMDTQVEQDAAIEQMVKSLSKNQVEVLVEALDFSIQFNAKSKSEGMQWYKRGDHGFGISRRTVQSLQDKGLVMATVWEQWHRDTQFVRLTKSGVGVAMALKQKAAAAGAKQRGVKS